MYGWCSNGKTCKENICPGGRQKLYDIPDLRVAPPDLNTTDNINLCVRHPATYSAYLCVSVDDQNRDDISVHLTGAHLGINFVSSWLQRGRGKSAHILSEKRVHRFCIFPKGVPESACSPKRPARTEGLLSLLPVVDFLSPESWTRTLPGVQVHRFAKYDAGPNASIVPPGRTLESCDSSIVDNTSLPESFIRQEVWNRRYSTTYYGSMVEIASGSVAGEFIFDATRRYIFDGCEKDYRVLPQPAGDRAVKTLSRRVHRKRLVAIRSTFSNSYFHFLVEAAPRLLYVLERMRADSSMHLLVDPMRYGSRRPHLEVLVGILGIPASQIVEYDQATLYTADTLFVPPGTPCNNPPPALFRDFSATVRARLLQIERNDDEGLCVSDHEQYVVLLVRTKEAMNPRLGRISGEAMKEGLRARLPLGTYVLPFYGNESMVETARIFAGAAAVVGHTGAGFSNLIFSKPWTVMVMVTLRSLFLETHAYDPDRVTGPQMIDTLGPNPYPSSVHMGTALKLGMIAKQVIVENMSQFPMDEFADAVWTGLTLRKTKI